MCGRISLHVNPYELSQQFGVTLPRHTYQTRFNIAPSQQTLMLRTEGGQRQAVMARWGYVPTWRAANSDNDKRPAPINARSESAASSRMFATALQSRRCVIPATGFYEWQQAPGRKAKRPHHITPANGTTFALAGIWSPGRQSSNTESNIPGSDIHKHNQPDHPDTFAILTCPPNDTMRPIHDRMPVIIPMDQVDRWLDPGLTDVGEIESMLRPAGDGTIETHEVSTRVNSPAHDDAGCLEPPGGDGLWGVLG